MKLVAEDTENYQYGGYAHQHYGYGLDDERNSEVESDNVDDENDDVFVLYPYDNDAKTNSDDVVDESDDVADEDVDVADEDDDVGDENDDAADEIDDVADEIDDVADEDDEIADENGDVADANDDVADNEAAGTYWKYEYEYPVPDEIIEEVMTDL